MPKNFPIRCKVCRKSRRDGWHISRRGLCDECAYNRMVEAFRNPTVVGEAASERARLGWETRRERQAALGVGGGSAKPVRRTPTAEAVDRGRRK